MISSARAAARSVARVAARGPQLPGAAVPVPHAAAAVTARNLFTDTTSHWLRRGGPASSDDIRVLVTGASGQVWCALGCGGARCI